MKPTKTVNLDEIYVRKPCIGEELSGRVKDLEERFDDFSKNYGSDSIIEDTLVDDVEAYGNNLRKRSEPSDEDVEALKKKILAVLNNADNKIKIFETNTSIEAIQNIYINAKDDGEKILLNHKIYQFEIKNDIDFLMRCNEINYAGALGENDIVGKNSKYSNSCCPYSKSIYDKISLDKNNTKKIILQEGKANIKTKRNGGLQTVSIQIKNIGFLDGINNVENENQIIVFIKNSLTEYIGHVTAAYNTINDIINNDINTVTKDSYNDISNAVNAVLTTFKGNSGPIIDNLRAIEEPNYENEFQTIRDNFNGLNDAQEAERKTEHAKHHKNGVKVTFYTNPNDYTGPTSVKPNAINVIRYFEPHTWPDAYSVDGESGPNYTFRSNSWVASEQPGDTIGTKIKEIAADPQNVIEINAYGLWNLTVDIDYNDDGKNDKLEVTTPNSRYTKSDIKFKAEEHYKTIENFNKSLISFNPEINNENELILVEDSHYIASYSNENLCILKIYIYEDDYENYDTLKSGAKFITYGVPKNTVIDRTVKTNILSKVYEKNKYVKDLQIDYNFNVGNNNSIDIKCIFVPDLTLIVNYQKVNLLPYFTEITQCTDTERIRDVYTKRNFYDWYHRFEKMFDPQITDNDIKDLILGNNNIFMTDIKEEDYNKHYNSGDVYQVEVLPSIDPNSDEAFKKKKDITVNLTLYTIEIDVTVHNKKTNEETHNTYKRIGRMDEENIEETVKNEIMGMSFYKNTEDAKYEFNSITNNENKLNIIIDKFPKVSLNFLTEDLQNVYSFNHYYNDTVDIDKYERTSTPLWPAEFIIKDEQIWTLKKDDPYTPTGSITLTDDRSVIPNYDKTKQSYNTLSVIFSTPTYTPKPGDTDPMPGQQTTADSEIDEYPLTVINHGLEKIETIKSVEINSKYDAKRQVLTQTISPSSRRQILTFQQEFEDNEIVPRYNYCVDHEENSAYLKVTSNAGFWSFSDINIDDLHSMPQRICYPKLYEDKYCIKMGSFTSTIPRSEAGWGNNYSIRFSNDVPIKQIIKAPYGLTYKNQTLYTEPTITNNSIITYNGYKYLITKECLRLEGNQALKDGDNSIIVAHAFYLNSLYCKAHFHYATDFDWNGIASDDPVTRYNKDTMTEDMSICDNPQIIYEDGIFKIDHFKTYFGRPKIKDGYTLTLRKGNNDPNGEIITANEVTTNVSITIDISQTKELVYNFLDMHKPNLHYTFYISKDAPTTQESVTYGDDFAIIGNPKGTPVALNNGYQLTGDVEIQEGEDRQTKAKQTIMASIQNGGGIIIKVGDDDRIIKAFEIA